MADQSMQFILGAYVMENMCWISLVTYNSNIEQGTVI